MPIAEPSGVTHGTKKEKIKQIIIPGRLILSGIIWCSRSIKVMTISAAENIKAKNKERDMPKKKYKRTKVSGVISSTEKILKRYRRLTVPAPGSKDYVTYKRYIKVEGNGFLACQAVGCGIGNRHVSRYTEYAYI